MRRSSRLWSVTAALALIVGLSACGDDDATSGVSDTTQTTAAAPTDTAAVSDADPEEGEEPVAGCQRLDERPDGVYRAGDGGQVELQRDGDAVTIVDARPAEGWSVEEDGVDDPADDPDDPGGDEVEVTFSQDERSIDFEAVVADDELVIEICES